MKFINEMDDFLDKKINLNKDRVNTAQESIETLGNFVANSDTFKEIFTAASPQGSFRHRTIIKPPSEEYEFDVDLLVELDEVPEWEPKDYLEKMHDIFKSSSRYEDIVDRKGKTRCVTIDYASDFHVDIVPCIKLSDGYVIMNKETNEFEQTDGEGYGNWFENQNEITGDDRLIKVARIVKYIRDYGDKIQAKSVILTTLLGAMVGECDENDFEDLPTTLGILSGKLANFLNENEEVPEITNPVLDDENFNRHWDQEKYDEFKAEFLELAKTIDSALVEEDEFESLRLWRLVLGDNFAINISASASKLAMDDPWYSEKEEYLSDYGIQEELIHEISIDANVEQPGWRRTALSKIRLLLKKSSIDFEITNHNIPIEFEVWWKVKNQSQEAKDLGDLRGEITRNQCTKRENTKYMGDHYVECYAISGDRCIAKAKKEVKIGLQ